MGIIGYNALGGGGGVWNVLESKNEKIRTMET